MKKILSVLLIFGLVSVVSATPIPTGGTIGFDVVRSDPSVQPDQNPDYGTQGRPLEDSEIIYVDIVAYNQNAGVDDYLGINSTGNIIVSITGPGTFQLPGGIVRNDNITPAGLAAIGLTYYDDYTGGQTDLYGSPHMFDYYDPPGPPLPYAGFAYANVAGPQILHLAGGVDSTGISWIMAPGVIDPVVMFDHIPIHCEGDGNILVTVSPYPANVPGAEDFEQPWVADGSFNAFADNNPGGGEIEIWQVPEPMTMALLGLGGLALIRRRRV